MNQKGRLRHGGEGGPEFSSENDYDFGAGTGVALNGGGAL